MRGAKNKVLLQFVDETSNENVAENVALHTYSLGSVGRPRPKVCRVAGSTPLQGCTLGTVRVLFEAT